MDNKRIKGLNVLSHLLITFNLEIMHSIYYELIRIGRKVKIAELKFNPFGQEVSSYVELIGIDGQDKVSLDTSFEDVTEKLLSDFIANSQIDAYGLLDLLELLKLVNGACHAQTSVLRPVSGETVSYEGHWENWICVCGNRATIDGFYTCDADGDLIQAVVGSGWDGLYRCERCGRVIDQRDHKVIGINLHPYIEEV